MVFDPDRSRSERSVEKHATNASQPASAESAAVMFDPQTQLYTKSAVLERNLVGAVSSRDIDNYE